MSQPARFAPSNARGPAPPPAPPAALVCQPLWPPGLWRRGGRFWRPRLPLHLHWFDSSQGEDRGACVGASGSGIRGSGWAGGPSTVAGWLAGWRTQQHPTCAPMTGAACTSVFTERRRLVGPVLRRHICVAPDTHRSAAALLSCTHLCTQRSRLAGRGAPKKSRPPGTERRPSTTRGARE